MGRFRLRRRRRAASPWRGTRRSWSAGLSTDDGAVAVRFDEDRATEAVGAGRSGKMPTTSGCRRSALSSRSWPLVDQIWRQWADGEARDGEQVGLGVGEQRCLGRELPVELVDDSAAPGLDLGGVEQLVHTGVATNAWANVGTQVSRSGVRHRCQAAPGSTAAMACSRPSSAEEPTKATPESPGPPSPAGTPSSPPRPRWWSSRRRGSPGGRLRSRRWRSLSPPTPGDVPPLL